MFSSSGTETKQPYLFRLPPFCWAFVALPKFSTSLSLPVKTRDHFTLLTGLKATHSVGSGKQNSFKNELHSTSYSHQRSKSKRLFVLTGAWFVFANNLLSQKIFKSPLIRCDIFISKKQAEESGLAFTVPSMQKLYHLNHTGFFLLSPIMNNNHALKIGWEDYSLYNQGLKQGAKDHSYI